jgi:uncharacterized protein DUF4114
VPGVPGSTQQLSFTLNSSESAFRSETGFFVVDDAAGRIGTQAPGDTGYAAAALARAHAILTSDRTAGAAATVTVQGGQFLGFYLVQNTTLATMLAANPTNGARGSKLAFFSFKEANPDRVAHVTATGDAVDGRLLLGWEDLTGGGDRDYNDRVLAIRLLGAQPPAESLRAPAGPGRTVTANFRLQNAVKSGLTRGQAANSVGEVGFFLVDAPDGRIGNLDPGDPGYVQAALGARQQIFAAGAAVGTQASATISGGSLIGFYLIDSGTAAGLLTLNPNNTLAGSAHVYFSFTAANPDSVAHFRNFSPEAITRSEPTASDPLQVHGMSRLNGGSADFDDLFFTVEFAAAP